MIEQTKVLLMTLDEPVRSMALENLSTEFLIAFGVQEISGNKLADALYSSFSWVKSSQGHKFWLRVYIDIIGKEDRDKIEAEAKQFSCSQILQNAYLVGAYSKSTQEYWYKKFKLEL